MLIVIKSGSRKKSNEEEDDDDHDRDDGEKKQNLLHRLSLELHSTCISVHARHFLNVVFSFQILLRIGAQKTFRKKTR